MKICVFSDSHGYAKNMIEAVRREKPALCFFLGDGESDLVALCGFFPDLPVYAVRGNCDMRSKLPSSLQCTVGGVKIFAAHGHLQEVKYDPELTTLLDAAGDTDVVLFGHTHDALQETRRGKRMINPGTIGRSKNASYALLEIDQGEFFSEIKKIGRTN